MACSDSPASGIVPGRGTEQEGKVLHRADLTTLSCYLFLGHSHWGKGPEFCLLWDTEQSCSWLAVRAASRWIPSFNPLFCIVLCSWFHPNCLDQPQLPSKSAGKSPLSPYSCFQTWTECHSPGNCSSVVPAVLGAQRKLWSSFPF